MALTGELAWIPCGHPPPLLIRDNKVIKELFRRPWPPLGIAETPRAPASDNGDLSPPVYTEHLEPRDRILLYTDGVVEGRARGSQFGLERLTDFIEVFSPRVSRSHGEKWGIRADART